MVHSESIISSTAVRSFTQKQIRNRSHGDYWGFLEAGPQFITHTLYRCCGQLELKHGHHGVAQFNERFAAIAADSGRDSGNGYVARSRHSR